MTPGPQMMTAPAVSRVVQQLSPPPLVFRNAEHKPGQVLGEVQLQFYGLWKPEGEAHTQALGRIYGILKPLGIRAEERGIGPRLASVLSEIEDLMIDLGGVHLLEALNDERGWDGLNKIAMHHEGEDRVPAVRALARQGQLEKLATIAESQSDSVVASAAMVEMGKLAVINRRHGPDNVPYSEVVYKLGQLATYAKTTEARNFALLELKKLAEKGGEVGTAAKNELGGPSVGANLETTEKIIRRIPDEIRAGVEKPDVPDEALLSKAWDKWRENGWLQRLNDHIEWLAREL